MIVIHGFVLLLNFVGRRSCVIDSINSSEVYSTSA